MSDTAWTTTAHLIPDVRVTGRTHHVRLLAADGVPLNLPGQAAGLVVEATQVIEGDAGPEVHVTVWGATKMFGIGLSPHTPVTYDLARNTTPVVPPTA